MRSWSYQRHAVMAAVIVLLWGCAIEQGRKLPPGAYDGLIEGKTTSLEAQNLLGPPFATGRDGPNTTWSYSYARADYAARALTMGLANQKNTLEGAELTFNPQGVLIHKKYVGTVLYQGGIAPHQASAEETQAALPNAK